jgi:hypothetical protein
MAGWMDVSGVNPGLIMADLLMSGIGLTGLRTGCNARWTLASDGAFTENRARNHSSECLLLSLVSRASTNRSVPKLQILLTYNTVCLTEPGYRLFFPKFQQCALLFQM